MATVKDALVPDIGDFKEVEVIDVLVKPGDTVQPEDPLVTLESDKASMDIPATDAGIVQEITVKVGDKISEGSVILRLLTSDDLETAEAAAPTPETAPPAEPGPPPSPESAPRASEPEPAAAESADLGLSPPVPAADLPEDAVMESPLRPPPVATVVDQKAFVRAHASPAVRRFARELGVDLSKVQGSGRKGRVTKEDVQGFVKQALHTRGTATAPTGGVGIPPIPEVDFSKFGPVEVQPLSRIKRKSGPHLHRVWLNVPMVTHHDEADITELEAFRKSLKDEAAKQGVRVTPLAFLLKASAAILRMHPHINASLAPDGESLVLKQYCHIGVAVDTPNGLVVPVIQNVDQKGIFELAAELGEVSARARDGKLKPQDLQGGCFSISSLGGIGGTAFTPLVNAPEVAILGVTKARMSPVWNGTEFVPRLLLPLDLTYDHRVIDGAQAARIMVDLCMVVGDLRRLLL